MITLQKVLQDSPLLHKQEEGSSTSWQLSDEALHFIDKNVNENSTTLETGAGISTILFAIKSSYHTCICPNQEQINLIKNYCQQHQISTEKIDFKVDVSENVLPLAQINELDLVLIDGSHAFPVPFLDWFYTYQKLKVGGRLIVDDTQLWTGYILKKFLLFEPEWKFNVNSPPRSAFFTKVKPYNSTKWHGQQPYLMKNSYFSILGAKLQVLKRLLLNGQFGRLSKLLVKQLGRSKTK
ncbi:MAG: class I SAM-dependent methyltransferase [Cyanobacteria bacterium J06621_8]